jgi:hypothetical protein
LPLTAGGAATLTAEPRPIELVFTVPLLASVVLSAR